MRRCLPLAQVPSIAIALLEIASPRSVLAFDRWSVTSNTDDSVLRVIPESASLQTDDSASALVEQRLTQQEAIRRRLLVTSCAEGKGLVSIEHDDTGLGVQEWHSNGRRVFDMLAVRVCKAAQQQPVQ